MGLEQIAARAIKALKSQHRELTPEEFLSAFCKELKKDGLTHHDCDKLQRFIVRLDEGYQKLIRGYNPKTVDELLIFLVSQINRLNPSEAAEYSSTLFILLSKTLKTVKGLRHKEASKLASQTLDILENTKSTDNLLSLSKEWDSLCANYKPNEFKPIEGYCPIKSHFLDDSVRELAGYFDRKEQNAKAVSRVLSGALKPSFSKEIAGEAEEYGKRLVDEPDIIGKKKIQTEIKSLVSKRIFFDNKEIKQKISEIDSIVSKFYTKLAKFGEFNVKESQKINSLKEVISEGGSDFDGIKGKLNAIVTALDEDILQMMTMLKEESAQIRVLKKKIELLEGELESAKEESGVDFLTKLLSRKSLEEELSYAEEGFLDGSIDYSIVFFDIDHFKMINDSYGHMAGDVVLTYLAQILKKKIKESYIVGRYDGGTFLVILPDTVLTEALEFAKDAISSVGRTKFIYKDKRIEVTISAGCAERKENNGLRDIIKKADEQLRIAKQNGRNCACPS